MEEVTLPPDVIAHREHEALRADVLRVLQCWDSLPTVLMLNENKAFHDLVEAMRSLRLKWNNLK